MTLAMIWMEGVPPEVEQRARESIARNKAAVRAMDANPGCPVARAGIEAARIEGERAVALLAEWTVDGEGA